MDIKIVFQRSETRRDLTSDVIILFLKHNISKEDAHRISDVLLALPDAEIERLEAMTEIDFILYLCAILEKEPVCG